MKKYFALTMILVFVGVVVSIALAAAVRQELVPYAASESDASGKAIINEPNGNVVLQVTVSVKGLLPTEEYTVWMKQLSGWAEVGKFTTNQNGNGSFHRNYLQGEINVPTPGSIAVNETDINTTVLIDEDF